ncbi:hypothetical protein [Ruficoccus amylovorans]|uniref:hypothetical protein n=1 Tax=Ruficoccus amylovorans TaxID=1804625 RepID=UPI001FE4D0DE|nr:hypothetical protein [Ruficoccus amylovorans]
MNRQLTTFLGFMAGWIGRRQQLVIDYLLEENRVLKEQFDATGKKLRLTNAQRRNLAIKGRKLRWAQLMQYASLVKPETLYAWYRRFVQLKYTAKTRVKTAGQSRMEAIRELCLKFAVENTRWGYGRIQGARRPYLDFQRWKFALLTLCSRHTSSTLRPSSASRKIATTCSSVYLFRFMFWSGSTRQGLKRNGTVLGGHATLGITFR